ncbi:unnamed protein product [Knipowitschia caucasica]
MAKFGPPETFDFSKQAEWPIWRRRFDRYRVATKLDRDSGEVQVNTLLYALGREAEPIYDSFVYSDSEDENSDDEERTQSRFDYSKVIAKFTEHFVPKRNVIHDRALTTATIASSLVASGSGSNQMINKTAPLLYIQGQ